MMVRTRDQIVAGIERRNEIRREARLPPLDMPCEVEREQDADQLREFNDAVLQHAVVFQRMSDKVWADFRVKHGPAWGGSPSARWAVGAVVGQRFRQFLAARGYAAPPDRNAIQYGGDRSHLASDSAYRERK